MDVFVGRNGKGRLCFRASVWKCWCMAVVRGIAMYVGGAVFSDKVLAAIKDTR